MAASDKAQPVKIDGRMRPSPRHESATWKAAAPLGRRWVDALANSVPIFFAASLDGGGAWAHIFRPNPTASRTGLEV
jgi:hypothetical protein